jgi:basic amino acid/polyamine antiporter, APA family
MKVALKREVGFWGATLYGIGIILGAGIYALIGNAAGVAGNSLWLSFVFGAFVATFTGLSYMELISMFPKAAAEYTYVKNAFRSKLLGFNVGWIEIFIDVIATAAVALGFAGYFHALFGTSVVITAICLIFIMSFVNFLGIKESSTLNTLFSVANVGGLIIVIVLAFGMGKIGTVDYMEMPNGITGTLGAAALIFFAYIGFEDMANIGDETKNPRKVLPKALLTAVAVTTVLYVLTGISVVSLVGWQDLATSEAPLAFAVSSVIGSKAFWIMGVIALFATANTVLVSSIVSSRMIWGMALDGSLPKIFRKVHGGRRTPHMAIIATMIVSMTFVLLGQIDVVASITDMGTLYLFMFVNAAAILLRFRMPGAKRAWRMPLNIGNFPLIPLFGLLTAFILATHLSTVSVVVGMGLAAMGVIVYLLYIDKGEGLKYAGVSAMGRRIRRIDGMKAATRKKTSGRKSDAG